MRPSLGSAFSTRLHARLCHAQQGRDEEDRNPCHCAAGRQGGFSMKWITREGVKVDRVACPWLIKKFIDPDAEFVFLSHDTDWANVREGTVYDVPGCELGHHGEQVSFDAILAKYGLTDPALCLL